MGSTNNNFNGNPFDGYLMLMRRKGKYYVMAGNKEFIDSYYSTDTRQGKHGWEALLTEPVHLRGIEAVVKRAAKAALKGIVQKPNSLDDKFYIGDSSGVMISIDPILATVAALPFQRYFRGISHHAGD